MKSFNRNQITLYGTSDLLEWIKSVEPKLKNWTLETLNNRPSAYMIEVEDQNCHGLVLKEYFNTIIKNELCNNLYINKDLWPQDITYDLFLKWFTYQYHEEVFDLCSKELKAYEEEIDT